MVPRMSVTFGQIAHRALVAAGLVAVVGAWAALAVPVAIDGQQASAAPARLGDASAGDARSGGVGSESPESDSSTQSQPESQGTPKPSGKPRRRNLIEINFGEEGRSEGPRLLA